MGDPQHRYMSTYFNIVWRRWVNLGVFENPPTNAGVVVDGHRLAGLPSDRMRTHHLVGRFANVNEGRRHGQQYR